MEFDKNIIPHVSPFDVIVAIAILVIGWWSTIIIDHSLKKMSQKAKFDAGVISFVRSILKTVLRIIVILCTISHLGINITPLLTALGAAAVTASLALKDSLSNIASGVIIVVNRIFSVGDYLKLDNVEGYVCKIEIFFTTLRTDDNKEISVPNSKITSSNIINCSAKEKRRLDLIYTVDYNSNIDKVKNALISVIKSNSKFLTEPNPVVEIKEYKESGIDFLVKVWCETKDYNDLYFYMQNNVKTAFDENKIQIPFNRIDVNLVGGKVNGI